MRHGKMADLEKMLMKGQEKDGEMSEKHLQVKMEMLKELMDHAKSAMGDKVLGGMEGLKKVSVMAPSKEGLEEGLEKAKELVESQEEPEMEEESEESSDMSPAEAEMKAEESKEEEKKEDEEEEDYSPFMKRKK